MIPEHAGEIDPQLDATVDAIIRDIGSDRSRLLDVVQAIQRRYGFISDDAINAVAAGLHMHAVEVEDTVSFYAFLNRTPKGRFHIRLSKTPISLMKGAAEVAQAFAAATGAPIGGTSPDQLFTLRH
jgi:[NiFe] hydrogenase diaphorase moiety large subunit